jgi:hypothetical protein
MTIRAAQVTPGGSGHARSHAWRRARIARRSWRNSNRSRVAQRLGGPAPHVRIMDVTGRW